MAEYFLQNWQVISVHGGNFSLFKFGGEPVRGTQRTELEHQRIVSLRGEAVGESRTSRHVLLSAVPVTC